MQEGSRKIVKENKNDVKEMLELVNSLGKEEIEFLKKVIEIKEREQKRIDEPLPIRDRGLCRTCVYSEKGCLECELCGLADEHYEGFGWDTETTQRRDSKIMCAYRTGICNYHLEDENKIVYCKDCKYGVRLEEPCENGEEWDCAKERIGTTWSGAECCPCGEKR